jgi:hypothetical protein
MSGSDEEKGHPTIRATKSRPHIANTRRQTGCAAELAGTQSLPISPTGRFALICCSALGRAPEARQGYDRAIGPADDPAVR